MARIYYDTEFLERGPNYPIEFISIGMVREDGTELHAVSSEFDQHAVRTHPFLGKHVWPHLPQVQPTPGVRDGGHPRLDVDHPDVRPRAQIARMVHEFVRTTPDVQLWAWYASYDHVVLSQLFGRMVDLPSGFPMFTCDLKQEAARLGDPQLPEQESGAHNALADARHLKAMAEHLTARA
ncbi:hypothetical protein F4561_002642 [Lipingzhangella halophila]|uniref:3'-5' exoribonuclease Rv2179c-like domain-containing protein n=1 Tax=Lipingzhangella halophila TaxID=1783352 RepID=A0A7W7RH82_9ACTN|nr:3'-5' exoribonuclease [Lipingzhangella halophila]MBB4931822.1 hypothetical protein [Lipingzhangella halophila]